MKMIIKKFLLILATVAILGQGSYLVHNEMMKRGAAEQLPTIVEVSRTMDIINGNVAYMTLDGIGSGTYDDIRENLLWLKIEGIKDAHITMCNGGGNIFEMWAIYDILKNAIDKGGLNLTTHAQGFVASAAVPIYLLGQVRTIGYNAYIMIHCHSGQPNEYRSESENTMLEQWTQRWIDILEDRTFMNRQKLNEHIATGLSQILDAFYMNAETALDYGFATKII